MNIEEAIEILSDDIVGYAKGHEIYEEAVKKLLTAYENEKEKNMELEKYKRKHTLVKENYISKSKVKEKIEELNKKYKDSIDEYGVNWFWEPVLTLKILQSLLEKE